MAMIAEMIHTASLIHDDVIDQSNFRRGKPSVNVMWNHRKVSGACMWCLCVYRVTAYLKLMRNGGRSAGVRLRNAVIEIENAI